MFKSIGGNIPGESFLDGNYPGGNLIDGSFPDTRFVLFIKVLLSLLFVF